MGKADFSGMNGKKDLYLYDMVHKAFLKVDEKGCEAAAATGAMMRTIGMPTGEPIPFKADHPFLLLIHDLEFENILFLGRVMHPK